jgi:hypothetical protein
VLRLLGEGHVHTEDSPVPRQACVKIGHGQRGVVESNGH